MADERNNFRGPRDDKSRRTGANDGNRSEGGYRGGNDRREGGFRGNDRNDGGFRGKPERSEGGFRGGNDRREGGFRGNDRNEGGFRGGSDRREGGFRGKPERSEGGFRGGNDRREGGFRGNDRNEGGFRGGSDRREGGFRGKPERSEGGYRGGNDRREGGFRGNDRNDGGFRGKPERSEGGFRGGNDRREGGFRGNDRNEGGFRGGNDRREGGFRGKPERSEGGFRGGNDRREGGFRGKPERSEGGYRGNKDRKEGGFRGKPARNDGPYRGNASDRPPHQLNRGDDTRRHFPGLEDGERPAHNPADLRVSNRADRPRSPEIDPDVTGKELDRITRAELRYLDEKNLDWVAKHLVMAGRLIDIDPDVAYDHAMAASRRGGRVAVVREAVGLTAYTAGNYAEALREFRTFRRISGSNIHLPVMADCERGLGKPEKALETAHSEEAETLDTPGRVEMAIVASGAQSDLGNREAALAELQIPQLDINRAFSFSPRLFEAYAMALEALGKNGEAELWRRQITLAERALGVGEFSDPDIMDLGEDEADEDAPSGRPRARDLVNDANPEADEPQAEASSSATDADESSVEAGPDQETGESATEVTGADELAAEGSDDDDNAPDAASDPSDAEK